MNFNHFDASGQAIMVDISQKNKTDRTARAQAIVQMGAATLKLIEQGTVAKGDVLGVASLAGIMAAKRTTGLIPLSHPLAIHAVSIEFNLNQ